MSSTNMFNRNDVIRLANRIGRKVIVVKFDSRTNFNIVDRGRVDIWGRNDVQIIHEPMTNGNGRY